MIKVTLTDGSVKEFGPGDHVPPEFPNDSVVSVSVPVGWMVRLYPNQIAAGTEAVLVVGEDPTGDTVKSMSELGLEGMVSGIQVIGV